MTRNIFTTLIFLKERQCPDNFEYCQVLKTVYGFISFTVYLGGNFDPPPPLPDPIGPPGKIFKYDLLKSYPGGRLGAFNTVDWESGHQNNEVQYYKSENAVQDPYTGEIVITAEKGSDGRVYSAR